MHLHECVDSLSCTLSCWNTFEALIIFPFFISKGESKPQHGVIARCCGTADCRAHKEILKMGAWDLSVWNCLGLCMNKSPTALCCAVDQCGFVPGKGLYLCLFMSFYFTLYFLSFFFLFHSYKTHITFTQKVIQQFSVQISTLSFSIKMLGKVC